MTLSDFLAELRGAVLCPDADAKALADIERWFRLLEISDNPYAIATYDQFMQIINRKAPLTERRSALYAAGTAAIARALADKPKPAPQPRLQ